MIRRNWPFLVLFPVLASCTTSKKHDTQAMGVRIAMPSALKNANGAFPVGKCIPAQVVAHDARGQDASVPGDLVVTLTVKESTEGMGAGIYEDEECTRPTSAVTLNPVGTPGISMRTVRVKSQAPGRVFLGADTAASHMRAWVTFE